MDQQDLRCIRAAIDVAQRARDNGNHPFGAVLADKQGQILLEAENTVVTDSDCTGHAETNLMRLASKAYDPAYLSECTLYTSTEPCPMCAAAIFWGNVRRVVFGLSGNALHGMRADGAEEVLNLPCREVFARGRRPIEVLGPLLEDEAIRVHEGLWL